MSGDAKEGDGETKAAAAAAGVDEATDRLIRKILFFKNPYDVLDVRPDTPSERVRKRYRRLTLAVHPDRCTHPRATDAAAALARAAQTLESPAQRRPYAEIMERARKKVADAWDRAGRSWRLQRSDGDDDIVGGGDDEEEKYDERFVYEWRRETHTAICEIEARMARSSEVAQAEEKRKAAELKAAQEQRKAQAEHQRQWEATRDTRVQSWRDFAKKKMSSGAPLVTSKRPRTEKPSSSVEPGAKRK